MWTGEYGGMCCKKNPLPRSGIIFVKISLMSLFFEKKNNVLSREANIKRHERMRAEDNNTLRSGTQLCPLETHFSRIGSRRRLLGLQGVCVEGGALGKWLISRMNAWGGKRVKEIVFRKEVKRHIDWRREDRKEWEAEDACRSGTPWLSRAERRQESVEQGARNASLGKSRARTRLLRQRRGGGKKKMGPRDFKANRGKFRDLGLNRSRGNSA